MKGDCAPGKGTIALCSAGTADLPVAEEAAVTAELLGNTVDRMYDVGVAGIHRVLSQRDRLASARVVIVVAGMEGALPSVVAGMVGVPVIGVPTSVGYGASFGGVAALLGMLNSCANGVSVVNIDNGYGAGCIASMINHLSRRDEHDHPLAEPVDPELEQSCQAHRTPIPLHWRCSALTEACHVHSLEELEARIRRASDCSRRACNGVRANPHVLARRRRQRRAAGGAARRHGHHYQHRHRAHPRGGHRRRWPLCDHVDADRGPVTACRWS